jgi:alpha-mannosidase
MPYMSKEYKAGIQVFKNRVEQSIYKNIAELQATAWVTPEPVSFENKLSGNKIHLAIGESWGELWDCAWFNFKGVVPKEAAGKKAVLLIDISGELCLFDKDGCPIQGLTNVSSEFDLSLGKPGKRVVDLYEAAEGEEIIDIWADAGCNDLFGRYRDSGSLMEAYIAVCCEEMRKLYYDIEVLSELMQYLPEDCARYHSIMVSLVEAAKIMCNFDEEEAKKARGILAGELDKKGGDPSLKVSAIGHAHIDLAWLWPIRETIRKGARTFSTALRNMEKYPDYVFGASQPQLYQWMKDRYPLLYEKIKQRVQEGRWEAQGAMWVEPDTNISGGEALVRQVLYGKKFFKEEFDKEVNTLWLPDVFGYSAALPQILKKSDVDYFMTIKLSWNTTNRFPHHTFKWEGLDGSQVLAHMPPEGTYNSPAAPRAIVKAEKEFLDKGVSDECLMLFGIGDGGGGPGEEHLERLMREKNLSGLAPVVQEPSADFFGRINKNKDRYKTWKGELYLEKHQGTYTSQARNKKYNRKLEIALRELELAASIALVKSGKEYPQKEIEDIWKEVLLYQFHDILPGSSIKRVYDESVERYESLLSRVEEITLELQKSLTESKHKGSADSAVVFNSLNWERRQWININGEWKYVKVPSLGSITVEEEINHEEACAFTAEYSILENDKLKVAFNSDGTIGSVFDKEYLREAITPGYGANKLEIYNDSFGDAWDFTPAIYELPKECFILENTEVLIDGPKKVVKQHYKYNESTLVQEISLISGSKVLEFNTIVDWKETGKMLRTSFPANVYTNEVACDIQFGNIKRPTHDNTSWDMAKYEICAHKWVDLSQGEYGVALINDCKYGHRVKDNTISLNLLRSTTYPGTDADKAVHEFKYCLYPHTGDYRAGEVVRRAYEVNIPLSVIELDNGCDTLNDMSSFIAVDTDNIIIEAVKKAEDNDDLIVRFYETHGCGTKAKIDFGFEAADVSLVNLIERDVDSNKFDKGSMTLEFGPFEIHTLRVKLN